MYGLPYIALALFVCAAALWKPLQASRPRFRSAFVFLALWLTLWRFHFPAAQEIELALVELAGLQVAAGVVFDLAVRLANAPRIVIEMGVVAGYAVILLDLMRRLGVNITGIFATSAVATAIIGLALQDMLSNIAGGVALEMERGIRAGDFIRCGDVSGWVQHVRLRHTALDTPDGDRVILPNSFLTRSPVIVLGRLRRHFIPFTMSYARNPHELMDVISAALRASPITGVAPDPPPDCIIRELATGHVLYTAVVWMLDPGRDAEAVSAVLNRIYFALRRAGLPAEEISWLVEMKQTADGGGVDSNPIHILRHAPIFRPLDDQLLFELGTRMRHLAFSPGEYIIRQKDEGDSMYFVTAGEVAVNLSGADGLERQVAVIEPGGFFGEASLLTGEPRNANAVAVTRVDCFKLDRAGLEGIMTRHPELAEEMSVEMARRQAELAGARDSLDRDSVRLREEENQKQLLVRIRKFFGLSGAAAVS